MLFLEQMSQSEISNDYLKTVPQPSIWQVFKVSLVAGAVSNMAGTVAGHPLDTIRVSYFFNLNNCVVGTYATRKSEYNSKTMRLRGFGQ